MVVEHRLFISYSSLQLRGVILTSYRLWELETAGYPVL